MKILGIETSCDETSAAVIEEKKGCLNVVSNIVSSQIKLHAQWGGVVPNLAAREHVKNILPVIEEALHQAKVSSQEIDLLAVTQGPGLIPALLIGVNAAKTLSYLWEKPLLGIHHIEGHIYANFIENKISAISNFRIPISKQIRKSQKQNTEKTSLEFPLLALVVSGGHTQLVLMKKHLDYQVIGQTLDDAAGEAFDKVARILGLSYPGGPAISQKAKLISNNKYKKLATKFPRPLIHTKDFNFSFSGLKTAVLYLTRKNESLLSNTLFIKEICHDFQQSVIDVLIHKTLAAAKEYQPKTIILAGGVSANWELRKQLGEKIALELPGIRYQVPEIEYSGDNAAMIAAAGYFRWKNSKNKKQYKKTWENISADSNLKLS